MDIEFTWSRSGEGDDRYVTERTTGSEIVYGPMPAAAVEPFIVERKRSITDTFIRIYAEQTNG